MTRITCIIAAGAATLFTSASFAAMSDWDANNDGVISNQEFMTNYKQGEVTDDQSGTMRTQSGTTGTQGGQTTTGEGQAMSWEQHSSSMFSEYDADQSGDLDEEEFQRFNDDQDPFDAGNVATQGQLPKPGDMKGEDASR